MRVAVVDPAAFSLPYDTELCSALARAGMDVTLFTTAFAHGPMPQADGFRIVKWFYAKDIPGIGRRRSRALQHPRDLMRLRRYLDANFDIVQVQWCVSNRFDPWVWSRSRIPTVFTAHNALPREGGGESLECDRLRSFDGVVVHSQYGEEGLRRSCDRLPPVWRIPHGELGQYRSMGDPATEPLELEPGPVVSLLGLLRPYKGADVLLDAWPRVREQIPGATLVIAGRPMGVTLPDPLPDGVQTLTRFVQDKEFAWLLRRSDAVCLPYTAVDLSGVLFSALALGKPLVLTNVGGFAEFAGSGAILAEPSDPASLADAIVTVLLDGSMRQRLSSEASTAAATTYSWDAIAAEYRDRYAQLVTAGTA